MKITLEFLKSNNACAEGLRWVIENNLIDLDAVEFIQALIEGGKLDWANWLIVRVMTYEQCVAYAIFDAEQVIDLYEKKYPDDKRPRQAIEAAKECLRNPTNKNKAAANAVAYAAHAAYAAAYTAYAAAAYTALITTKVKILEYGINLLKK